MRSRFLSALVLLLCGTNVALFAQAPGSAPQRSGQGATGQPTGMNPEQKAMLDSILAAWETDAKSLQSLLVQFNVKEKDPVFQKETNFYGEAKVLKLPTGQYGLKLETFEYDRNGRPDPTRMKEKFVCSGTWFYTFDFGSKVITFRRLDAGNLRPDDGPFAFLFGMKATEAWKRFNMSVVQQDKDYTWIRFQPLTPQDQKDFQVAQLGVIRYANAVSPKDFPLRIMWREPGNKEITWDFKAVVRNDLNKVSMTDFSVENEKKQGWQLREAPALGAAPTGATPGVPTSGGPPRK